MVKLTTDQIAEHYRMNIERYRQILKTLEQKEMLYSRLRLLNFLALIPVFFWWNNIPYPLLFVAGIVFIFLQLVKRHEDIKEDVKVKRFLLRINEEELRYITAFHFPDIAFHENAHRERFAADLDLFGEKSVFHLINRAQTFFGKERLADTLTAATLTHEEILQRQEAIRELASNENFRQLFLAHAHDEALKSGDLKKMIAWLGKDDQVPSLKWYSWFRYVWPLFSIGSAYYCWQTENWMLFTPVAIAAWAIIARYKKHTDALSDIISEENKTLKRYSALFREIEQQAFSSPVLKRLSENAAEANAALKKLAAVSDKFDSRKNVLGNFLLNTFGLYDLQCISEAEYWKTEYRAKAASWFQVIGETEMLISAATFHFNHPAYCFPVPEKSALHIVSKNLGHPLIPPQSRISNSVSFTAPQKLFFITGSNMSGKSTFLRSLGINLILAQCGFPVCAESFSFTPMKILSSIRVSDSLSENTSLFYAELKQLRAVLDELEKGTPSFVLLDEILRGTNSADKYHGAYHFIKKMLPHNVMIFFATHDLKLCEMKDEYPEMTANYRFEGIIENNELHFPYRIEYGIVQNRTASFLMRQLKLID